MPALSVPTSSRRAVAAAPGAAAARRLPSRAAFLLLASIIVFLLASSSAPTPLYAVYQAEWGFSPLTTTVVFGVYALAVLAALLTLGSLSDHVGRRPVLGVALTVQAVTMLVFASAGSVPGLLGARVLQGLATGAAVGALGAGLLDLDARRGTVANAVAAPLGTGLGALASGLLVQYLPHPTRLVYLVLAGVFVVQGLGVLGMAESGTPRPGALGSLRPRLALPAAVRPAFLLTVPVLFAAWALAGFYGALGPALVRVVVGHSSFVLSGLALAVLASSGAVTVLLLHGAPPAQVMLLGTASLLAGVAVTLVAISGGTATLFFVGTALAGIGFGAGFQGAVRTVVPLAAPNERAGVLSLVFVVSYLAMGLPAVVAGFLVVHGGGLLVTAREYAATVVLLAAGVLVGLVRQAVRVRRAPLPAA